jgi:hypothetical protein
MTLLDLDDRLTVTFDGCGWTHWQIMLRMQFKRKRVQQVNVLVIKNKKSANCTYLPGLEQ